MPICAPFLNQALKRAVINFGFRTSKHSPKELKTRRRTKNRQIRKIGVISTNKLVMNVVKKPFEFRVFYTDGHEEVRTVEAESKDAAFLILQDELWDEAGVEKTELIPKKQKT